MEKTKKVILVDSSDKTEVEQAIVIHESIDGRYLLSSHLKTADKHWEGTSSYDADGSFVIDGYSLKEGSSLYSLSKIQAYILSNKKTDSWLFQHVLNKVLKNNEIATDQLTEKALEIHDNIIKDDFELVKPEVEKRDADLRDKMEQKKKADHLSNKKSQEAYSQKIFGYIGKNKEK